MSSVVFRTIEGRVVPIKVASGTPGSYPDNRVASEAGATAGRASASGAGNRQTPRAAGGRAKTTAGTTAGTDRFPTVTGVAGQVGLSVADRVRAVTNSASHWGTSPRALYDASRTATVTSRGVHGGISSAVRQTTSYYPTRSTPGLGGGTAGKLGAAGGVIGIAADTALSIDAGDSGRAAFGRAGAGFLGSVAAAGAGAKGGAAAGAAIGGAVGSVIPVVGTAAGAVAGATAGAVIGGMAAGTAGAIAARRAFDAVDTRINGPNARTKGWGGQQIR
jgi:hypothetical protein